MDINTRRKIVAILRELHDSERPLGSTRIGEALQAQGIDLSERTVRHYLGLTDKAGLTANMGKRGRKLTPQGERELESALVVDKVGFVAARVDSLAYQMSFSLSKRKG
ncbi:MAG TPA: winged-helix domain-containing protein, partial [bacterium]|nr:winged-helix domain-containing protein [bacterium]